MFGVALNMNASDFVKVFKSPKGILLGLFGQYIILPAMTFVLVYLLKPNPGLALGMFLVASCPGGNISNFISSLSKANVALSVSLTSIATLISPILTPFNFVFWTKLYEPTSSKYTHFNLSFFELASTVFVLLIIPMLLGIAFKHKWPSTTQKVSRYIQALSMLIFLAFVFAAFYGNANHFINYIGLIFSLVFLHNFVAWTAGFIPGFFGKLKIADRKSLMIETGIQNSGLALVIIFNFFEGLGSMAIIAAWWGIWHIVSGLAFIPIFRKWQN